MQEVRTMSDNWLTLAEARGQIMAQGRSPEEAQSELEADHAKGRRRATGQRVAYKYRVEPGHFVKDVNHPRGQQWQQGCSIEEIAPPIAGQPQEEIPQHWWCRANSSGYVSEGVEVYYSKNRVCSSVWGIAYINVYVSPLISNSNAVTAAPPYGQKLQDAKQYIAKHSEDLKKLGTNQAAKKIATAVGCSESHAKAAIRDEKVGGRL
jgi:hypothetical protein